MTDPKPTDWVRVRDDRTGHHYSVQRRTADLNKNLKILDAKAVDVNGRPLAPVGNQNPKAAKATDKKEG